jgi:hypothetical protein
VIENNVNAQCYQLLLAFFQCTDADVLRSDLDSWNELSKVTGQVRQVLEMLGELKLNLCAWKNQHSESIEQVGCAVVEARSKRIQDMSEQLMDLQLRAVNLSKQSQLLFSPSFDPESIYADTPTKAQVATSTTSSLLSSSHETEMQQLQVWLRFSLLFFFMFFRLRSRHCARVLQRSITIWKPRNWSMRRRLLDWSLKSRAS